MSFNVSAINISEDAIRFVSPHDSKWKNKGSVISQVSKNGLNLRHASQQLKNDKQVVLAAVNSFFIAFEFASQRLQRDPDVLQLVAARCGCTFDSHPVYKERIRQAKIALTAQAIDSCNLGGTREINRGQLASLISEYYDS